MTKGRINLARTEKEMPQKIGKKGVVKIAILIDGRIYGNAACLTYELVIYFSMQLANIYFPKEVSLLL